MDVSLSSSSPSALTRRPRRIGPLLGIAGAVFIAMLVAKIGSAHVAEPDMSSHFSEEASPAPPAPPTNVHEINRMKPQRQAEALLELAIGRSDGALDQISARVGHWRGHIQWNPQVAALSGAALNSNDLKVREAGVEIQLAAYDLRKSTASVTYLTKTAESSDRARKIWALWALGLMGNRMMGNRVTRNSGIDASRIVDTLASHLNDADEESRRWAVEGLGLVGSDQTIQLLLKTMHDDPAVAVRERAASGVAQSGIFAQDQRLSAVPQLLRYMEDRSSDSHTQELAFQALAQITRQHLPNNSAAWRSWYESQGQALRGNEATNN